MLQLPSYVLFNWAKVPSRMHFGKWSIMWLFLWLESLKDSGHKMLHAVLIVSYWCFHEIQKYATAWTPWLLNCFALGQLQHTEASKSINIYWVLGSVMSSRLGHQEERKHKMQRHRIFPWWGYSFILVNSKLFLKLAVVRNVMAYDQILWSYSLFRKYWLAGTWMYTVPGIIEE